MKMHQIIHCEKLNILKGLLVHRWVYSLIFSLLIFPTLHGQEIKSPFNGHLLHVDSLKDDFSFLVGGHFYGYHTNRSHFPAATLLGNLNRINQSNAEMLISLGDMFKEMEEDLPIYKRVLFSQLDLPLFNVVGNHDVESGQYTATFGTRWFSIDNDLVYMIFLDTELDDGSIKGEQLEFFKGKLAEADDQKNPHVMIFSHRPIWEPIDRRIEHVFRFNTEAIGGTNFLSEVQPELIRFKEKTGADIYWISGSLSGAPGSIFYHQDPQTDIYYLQAAIYNNPTDALLEVSVTKGNIAFHPFSLVEENELPIESYGIEHWEDISGKTPGLTWKQQLYTVYLAFTHQYFWWGVLAALLGMGGFWLVWKGFRK